jgi:phosphatidylserine decarboxylase
MGWFEHGSTIIVLAPAGFTLAPGVQAGTRQRAGHPLLLQTPASKLEHLTEDFAGNASRFS